MPRKQSGFSLIELVITIVLFGIISVVVGRITIAGLNTFLVAQRVSDTDWQGLLVLEMLTNDIHNIRSAGSISTISSSALTFVDVSGTTIAYSLSAGNLQRNGITVANGVTGLTLGYLDSDGVVTATAGNVRYITISVTLMQGNLSQVYTTAVGTRGMS